MKRNIILIVSCLLIIVGLLAAVSCGKSTQPTTTAPGTGTQYNRRPGRRRDRILNLPR